MVRRKIRGAYRVVVQCDGAGAAEVLVESYAVRIQLRR